MADNIIFLNAQFGWWILAISILLTLLFFWKEYSQSGTKDIMFKSVLIVLAISSLALIALKPAYNIEYEDKAVAVLTDAYKKQQLDSLQEEHPNLEIVKYNAIQYSKIKNASNIFILGNGIPNYDFYNLENSNVSYLPGEIPNGIVQLKYDQTRVEGNDLIIKGLYQNPKINHSIFLQDPAGNKLDSIKFLDDNNVKFGLVSNLKSSGNYIYNLVEEDSLGALINSSPLPVHVDKTKKSRILIINNFPTFETKYLKNYLSEAGHEVIIRSKITTGKYKFEYFNTSQIPIQNLTSENLSSLDLLIIDAESLQALSSKENSILDTAIREEGLGLFLQVDATYLNSNARFSVFNLQNSPVLEISLENSPSLNWQKQAYFINDGFGIEKIHLANQNLISAYKRYGNGKIGTTLLINTWQKVLDGNLEAYRGLWAYTIENIIKSEETSVMWGENNLLIYKDEPYNLELYSTAITPKINTETGEIIPVKQDFLIADKWRATLWPKNKGWHQVSHQNDSLNLKHYYVLDSLDWKALNATNYRKENFRVFNKSVSINNGGSTYLQTINPLWFFILFLFSTGILWLKPKL